MVRGLDAARLAQQVAEVNRLNKKLDGTSRSSKASRWTSSRMDLSTCLTRPSQKLDVVVASVHSCFDLPAVEAGQSQPAQPDGC